jgi:ribonuclease PH
VTDSQLDTADLVRHDGRALNELRACLFVRDYTEFAAGSVLAVYGRTKVLCTASVDEEVPRWMRGTGRGWVTAEYSLLPGSSPERVSREATRGRQSGRTHEIQRLIGRSLRSIIDLEALGERQIIIDCDVLQADGGTRTASISGAYVALHDACTRLCESKVIDRHPVREACAAVSVGIVEAVCMLDLDYVEDSAAEVDLNVVMTSSGRFVEVQGTAEGPPFARAELDEMLALAETGVGEILQVQREVLATAPPERDRSARL